MTCVALQASQQDPSGLAVAPSRLGANKYSGPVAIILLQEGLLRIAGVLRALSPRALALVQESLNTKMMPLEATGTLEWVL